ncbi:MAG: DUF1499 domain-containing protein [Candidatus Pelagadaptatus aseana]|uniref:DUF1499 domain-containing protein n=1 Tax=Candidatus Pelagadaptatus aseana TaxID=3120508 RepID=UPI0039B2ED99
MKNTNTLLLKAMTVAAVLVLAGCAGTRPMLGVDGGLLKPCPDKPNCVNSQAQGSDHFIEPVVFSGELADARDQLVVAINSMERAEIIESEDSYIRAEFTSLFFGFVDDVEFYLSPSEQSALIIAHVRSASRLGHSDFGVNRERVEAIREKLKRKE